MRTATTARGMGMRKPVVVGGERAPRAHQTIRFGAGSNKTASKAPTVKTASTVASSVRGAPADAASVIKARARQIVAAKPRSDKNAAQSLEGHGFEVMPSSLSSDGSLGAAYFG